MEIDLYHNELCLAHNAPIRLPAASGVRIICTAGMVWLTVAGEGGDIFLMPGDSHVVRGRGLALLEAIGSGQVRLEKTVRPLPTLLFVQLRRWLRPVGNLPFPDRRRALSLRAFFRQANA